MCYFPSTFTLTNAEGEHTDVTKEERKDSYGKCFDPAYQLEETFSLIVTGW